MAKKKNEVAKAQEQMVPSFDVKKKLPNLHKEGLVIPFELQAEYWSPEEGEVKRGFIQELEVNKFPDMNDESIMVDVECIRLLEQQENGKIVNVINGSRRLVSAIKQNMREGKIVSGTPLEITYRGRKKNKKNDKSSDRWSVNPIAVGQ